MNNKDFPINNIIQLFNKNDTDNNTNLRILLNLAMPDAISQQHFYYYLARLALIHPESTLEDKNYAQKWLEQNKFKVIPKFAKRFTKLKEAVAELIDDRSFLSNLTSKQKFQLMEIYLELSPSLESQKAYGTLVELGLESSRKKLANKFPALKTDVNIKSFIAGIIGFIVFAALTAFTIFGVFSGAVSISVGLFVIAMVGVTGAYGTSAQTFYTLDARKIKYDQVLDYDSIERSPNSSQPQAKHEGEMLSESRGEQLLKEDVSEARLSVSDDIGRDENPASKIKASGTHSKLTRSQSQEFFASQSLLATDENKTNSQTFKPQH